VNKLEQDVDILHKAIQEHIDNMTPSKADAIGLALANIKGAVDDMYNQFLPELIANKYDKEKVFDSFVDIMLSLDYVNYHIKNIEDNG